MKQRLIITSLIALFLCLGTLGAIFWAKGYRPSFKEKTIKGTSLLVVNSYPEGASVYLNDKLTTATNESISFFFVKIIYHSAIIIHRIVIIIRRDYIVSSIVVR